MADTDLDLGGLDLGSMLGVEPEKEKAPPPDQGGIKVSHRMGARQLWRKASSEKALEEAMPWHFSGDGHTRGALRLPDREQRQRQHEPRSENTVLTVDRDLTAEYIQLFSEIIPFNKDCGAEPYQLPPRR